MANQYILKKIGTHYELELPTKKDKQQSITIETLTPQSILASLRKDRIFTREPVYIRDIEGHENLDHLAILPSEFKILYDKHSFHILNPYSGSKSQQVHKRRLSCLLCCKK